MGSASASQGVTGQAGVGLSPTGSISPTASSGDPTAVGREHLTILCLHPSPNTASSCCILHMGQCLL